MYVSFDVYTPVAIDDAWAKIDSFSGPISLGDNAVSSYHIGPMSAGSTITVFFYIKTTATTDISPPPVIGHDISLWEGNPDSTGALIQSNNFTFDDTPDFSAIEDTIESSSTKVRTVASGPSPATLGGIITITINGDTGNASAPISFTPASTADWPAGAYKLVSSTISLPSGTTLNNQLYYEGNIGSGTYIGTYKFVAVGTYTSSTITSPAQYLSVGNGMQHVPTDSALINGFIPVVPPDGSNSVVVTTSCTPGVVPTGAPADIDCTITFNNSGSTAITLDDIVEILPTSPASVSYSANSSTFNGSSIAEPQQSGATLTWSGQFQVPANSTRNLNFTATIPDSQGSYLFSAIGHIGTTQIDTTATLGDDVSATCVVSMTNSPTLTKVFAPAIIGPSIGAVVQNSTLTFTVNNPAGNPAQTGIAFTDTLPAGLNWSGAAVSPQCGGTLSYSGAGNDIISFSGGSLSAGPSSCTITADISGITPGLYTNTASNISGFPVWMDISGVNATLQIAPATLTKIFSPDEILLGSNTALNFVINNVPGNPPQGALAFTDTLPTGVTLVGAPVSPQCGGTVSYTGSDTINFSSGELTTGLASCTITATVTSSTTGIYTNGASNMSGLSTSLSNGVTDQSLTVNATPSLGNMIFSPTTTGIDQPATLSFSITSISTKAESVSFIESLPLGLTLANPINITSNCGGTWYQPGTSTPVSGGESSFEFSDSIPKPTGGSQTCDYSVKVTGTAAGTYTNNKLNILNTSNLTNGVTASNLTIIAPTLSKSFGAASIYSGDSTTLTFTLVNGASNPAQAGIAFTDTLPAGLTVSGSPVSPQCSGTVNYIGSDTISFSGGSLNDGDANCSIITHVTSSTAGTYVNGAGNLSGLSTGMINSVTDQMLIVTTPLPLITFLKSSQVETDPVNGATNPKAIPGAAVRYTLQTINFGTGSPDTNTLVTTDTIPANTSLYVGDLGQGSPVFFTDLVTSGFVAGDLNVSYSSDADCSTFSYTPVPGADGYDANVCQVRMQLNGTFNSASGGTNPSFSLQFVLRID